MAQAREPFEELAGWRAIMQSVQWRELAREASVLLRDANIRLDAPGCDPITTEYSRGAKMATRALLGYPTRRVAELKQQIADTARKGELDGR